MSSEKGKVAIIGSGLIGRSWAMLFASGGYTVSLFDVITEQLESAYKDIKDQITTLQNKGTLRGTLRAEDQIKLISVAGSLIECVQGAIHVQECIPEKLELKQEIFSQLDEVASDSVVLSSSSSAMPASMYTETLRHRKQCIVSHPVNPPYYMPLVELVPSPWTDPEVMTRTRQLMEDIGQSPVTLKKEVAGFIQPRIQYAIIQEAVKLVLGGVISAEDLDKVFTAGLGRRYAFMGPYQTAHLNAEGMHSYFERYAKMIYRISGSSGPMVPLNNNPALEPLFQEMEKLVPLESLAERRKWRDERIAALADLRRECDQNDAKQ